MPPAALPLPDMFSTPVKQASLFDASNRFASSGCHLGDAAGPAPDLSRRSAAMMLSLQLSSPNHPCRLTSCTPPHPHPLPHLQPPPKSVSFPHLDTSPLWSPMALFHASLQQHTLPGGGLAAAGNGPTRSTARAGAGAPRRGGHHSPPKQPPPLFDAGQAPQQAQQAGTLQHWKSEVSANMAALSPLPNGLAPAAAADPISPRAAALMAACQEAEHAPPARLVRLTSNLSSAAEAVAGEAAVQGSQPLVKQRSDLAELALMAEEESRAAAAAAAAVAAAAAAEDSAVATPAAAPAAAAAECVTPEQARAAAPAVASASGQAAGAAQVQQPMQQQPAAQARQQSAAKRPAEACSPDEQTAGKRQRSSGNGDAAVTEAAQQPAAPPPVKQEAAAPVAA